MHIHSRKKSKLIGIVLCGVTLQLFAQSLQSMKTPGDMTLFGNPDCSHWLRVEAEAKEVWLNAILSPINMGFMRREKPPTDKYGALTSLAPAAKFVDSYCASRPDTKAMSGAFKYFEELTAQQN
jgi:hypothetical protein